MYFAGQSQSAADLHLQSRVDTLTNELEQQVKVGLTFGYKFPRHLSFFSKTLYEQKFIFLNLVKDIS